MQVEDLLLNLNSANPDALRGFYRDVVGLPPHPATEAALQAGPTMFIIDSHSEITGPNKEPARYLFNLAVADLAGETERLKAAGVPCIRDQGREEWGGVMSTFVDPDGNYFQLIALAGAS